MAPLLRTTLLNDTVHCVSCVIQRISVQHAGYKIKFPSKALFFSGGWPSYYSLNPLDTAMQCGYDILQIYFVRYILHESHN